MFAIKQPDLSVEEIRKHWNDWVERYPNPWESVGRPTDPALMQIIITDIIQKLSLTSGNSFLDVGCGSGVMMNEIKKRVPAKMTGVDIAEKHIENARKLFPDIAFEAAPMENLPFADKSFDKILCYSTLTYCLDWKKAVDEVLRVCRDDGCILLADMAPRNLQFYFYWSVVSSIPAVLLNWKRLYRAVTWKQKDCPWYWTNLKEFQAYIESKDYRMKVLRQPENRQYGCVSYKYRRDILLEKSPS